MYIREIRIYEERERGNKEEKKIETYD